MDAPARSNRSLLLAVALWLASTFAPAIAAGGEIEGLHGEAAASIQAQVDAEGLRSPVASVFYGDLTGEGTRDAISFVYHDSGGSGPQLKTWIWTEAGGAYRLARTVPIDEVFGLDPRKVTFSPGRIVVTTSIPQGDDPHCCPTGERTFTLAAAGAVGTRQAASPQGSGNWVATVRTNPKMVNVSGVAVDGKAGFSGGCNPLLGPGLRGSLHGYEGDALQRVDDQSEAVTFDVAGRTGTASFAGTMHYFAPDEAWVTTEALPAGFLDAFGRGDALTIRNGRGEEVVSFGLRGSSKAVRTLREVCG
jgi:hypothetical protein